MSSTVLKTRSWGVWRSLLVPAVVLLAVGCVVLVSPPAPSAHEVLAVAQKPKRCPSGSAAAFTFAGFVCLKPGQKCTRGWETEYHAAGFHCHTGRLTRPKAAHVMRKVDVGGFRLAISCQGSGTPTVVLESGSRSSGGAWMLLQPRVAKTARVCSYDRAGLGYSDPRPRPGRVPAARAVTELHKLLAGAGISPPYVLGGWSLGGFLIRLYTMRYPAEVLGLVSVDSGSFRPPREPLPPQKPSALPDSFEREFGLEERADSFDLGARPLVVLYARRPAYNYRLSPQELIGFKRLARRSRSSILVRADDASHGIQLDAPGLTAEAFRLVIGAVRSRLPLPACAATKLARMGGTCVDPTSPRRESTR
ncbi:MAG: alpha/beta fold hydrolase [Gaiellaceae bacterium]